MCRHRDVEFMSGFRARRWLVGVAVTTKRHGDAVHRPRISKLVDAKRVEVLARIAELQAFADQLA